MLLVWDVIKIFCLSNMGSDAFIDSFWVDCEANIGGRRSRLLYSQYSLIVSVTPFVPLPRSFRSRVIHEDNIGEEWWEFARDLTYFKILFQSLMSLKCRISIQVLGVGSGITAVLYRAGKMPWGMWVLSLSNLKNKWYSLFFPNSGLYDLKI